MSNDNPSNPQSEDQAADQLITVHPTSLTNYPPVSEWAGANNGDAGANPTAGGFPLFHALRRHWLLAVLIGSGCAVAAGIVMTLLIKPQYTATAQLRIAQIQQKFFHDSGGDNESVMSYDLFKGQQVASVRSRYVVSAALRNLGPVMNSLPNLKAEDQSHNAVNWLIDKIDVINSKKDETVEVKMSSTDSKESAQIVNALVKAYFDEIVNVERLNKKQRYSDLQTFSAENENALRTKRTELRQLAENLGASGDSSQNLSGILENQMCVQIQVELQRMKFEYAARKRRISELVRLQEQNQDEEISPTEWASFLQQTSTEYRDLLQKKNNLDAFVRQASKFLSSNTKQDHLPPSLARSADELANTNNRIDELRKDAVSQVRIEHRIAMDRELKLLRNDEQIWTNQIGEVSVELETRMKKAMENNRTSIDVQMKQADIGNLERLLQNVNTEKDRLRVELKAAPRVEIMGDQNNPADVPETEDGKMKRYLMTLGGMMIAFVLPAGALVAWDMRVGKINAVADVQNKLGVTVLGSVPMIPARVIRRLGAASKRNQVWKVRLTESVDGVAARLLRKAEHEEAKMILISSAMPGEGKTTLSTQLAMSLARNERRTVLVDFDLRRPALDGVFGVSQSPGVCEALRGQGDILEMVQTTETENLSLVTAGRWDRQVLAALGNGSVGTVLSQLRENFDFVIIDSSPILPIVDTRLVSQYVDGVVLSVFRDVSQGGKVLAAQEILEAFGVRSVEAVVTGGGEHGYGSKLDYEATPLEDEVVDYQTQDESQPS